MNYWCRFEKMSQEHHLHLLTLCSALMQTKQLPHWSRLEKKNEPKSLDFSFCFVLFVFLYFSVNECFQINSTWNNIKNLLLKKLKIVNTQKIVFTIALKNREAYWDLLNLNIYNKVVTQTNILGKYLRITPTHSQIIKTKLFFNKI